jgi:hypothetical protein
MLYPHDNASSAFFKTHRPRLKVPRWVRWVR